MTRPMGYREFEAASAEGFDVDALASAIASAMAEAVGSSPEDVEPGGEGWVEGAGVLLFGAAYPEGEGEFTVLVYKELNEDWAAFDPASGGEVAIRPGYTLTLWDMHEQECWSFFADRPAEWPSLAREAALAARRRYGRWERLAREGA